MIILKTRVTLMAVVLCLFTAVNVSAFQTSVDTTVEDESSQANRATKVLSKLRSSDDSRLDIGGFLDEAYGFVPIVIPITEPAVGYGAAGALAIYRQIQR